MWHPGSGLTFQGGHEDSILCRDNYGDVIMGAMASQIISLTIVYSTVHSSADQRKHQSSTSLAFVRGIHRWSVKSPHKRPVTRKIFPFDDVIMEWLPRHIWQMSILYQKPLSIACIITFNSILLNVITYQCNKYPLLPPKSCNMFLTHK